MSTFWHVVRLLASVVWSGAKDQMGTLLFYLYIISIADGKTAAAS